MSIKIIIIDSGSGLVKIQPIDVFCDLLFIFIKTLIDQTMNCDTIIQLFEDFYRCSSFHLNYYISNQNKPNLQLSTQ